VSERYAGESKCFFGDYGRSLGVCLSEVRRETDSEEFAEDFDEELRGIRVNMHGEYYCVKPGD